MPPQLVFHIRARDWESDPFRERFEADLDQSGWTLVEIDAQPDRRLYVVTYEFVGGPAVLPPGPLRSGQTWPAP
jgi:hypothetical protein